MSDSVTLEQVRQQVAQLPPQEQLQLVAQISGRLSALPFPGIMEERSEKQARREREKRAEALLAELDAIAESIEGEFDSAEDLRQIRQERASRL
jgi:hypothetical protein